MIEEQLASTEVQPRRKRSWLKFSLRTALVLITVIAIVVGWFAQRGRSQKKVTEWVASLNANVWYKTKPEFSKQSRSPGPGFLRDSIGPEYYATIDIVHMDDRPVKDISPIANIPWLRHFEMCNCQVSDISPLDGFEKLEHLSISRNPIKDISVVRSMKSLKRLYAYETEFVDLSPLKELDKLERIVLWNSKVNDLTPLSSLTNLVQLELRGSSINDLSPLSKLANLEELNLQATQVVDVSPLRGLKNLKNLNLSRTNVFPPEIDTLRKELPNCKIVFK